MNNDLHLQVLPVVMDERTGVAVLSTHPHTGTPRVVVAVSDGSRLAAGMAHMDGSLDAAINSAIEDSDQVRAAKIAIELAGAADSSDAILEALAYPENLREEASQFLLDSLSSVRPQELAESVSRRVVDLLRVAGNARLTDLEFYSGDGERGERRRQAAESFPFLATKISANLRLKMAVDRSQPLIDAVASTLATATNGRAGKATVRRLRLVEEPPYGTDLDTVIEFSSRVSPDWIPSSGADWKAFCVVADGIVRTLGAPAEMTAPLVKGCGGRWVTFCQRLAAHVGTYDEQTDADTLRIVSMAFADLREMIQTFSEVVVMPLAAHGHQSTHAYVTPEIRQLAIDVAMKMICGSRSATALFENLRKWQVDRNRVLAVMSQIFESRREKLLEGIPADGWPALSDQVQAPNGLWLVPLNTPTLLNWESLPGQDPNGVLGLAHCVSSYASKCRRGDCHIVSVRQINEDGTYQRLSTIEFKRLGPTNWLHVAQHRGRSNRTPCPEATNALNWYVDAVRLGLVRIHRDRINAFHNHLEMDGIEAFCGYDWRKRDVLNSAVAPWGRFVDASYRRYGLDDLINSAEIAEVGSAFAPELLTLRQGFTP
jgi:hypothetical protein